MLVIIVSLGFGIVKWVARNQLAQLVLIQMSSKFFSRPRLGPTLRKVVGVGILYFIFAALDGTFRILDVCYIDCSKFCLFYWCWWCFVSKRKEDTDSKGVLAGIPLIILDISVCYWILTSLQQTMRTLRVRRNISKLSLYRHFTNTLIFSVIGKLTSFRKIFESYPMVLLSRYCQTLHTVSS